MHLRAEDIGSVVWCTGLTGDFTWVDPALLDGERMLVPAASLESKPTIWPRR